MGASPRTESVSSWPARHLHTRAIPLLSRDSDLAAFLLHGQGVSDDIGGDQREWNDARGVQVAKELRQAEFRAYLTRLCR
jgi:hypothetical protein